MKLEEAASILGVSLEDITIDGLKQTYKKLALAWDPEKCKDQNSKTKYFQISEAYKKLNSVMEGTDGYRGDDSHEIAAFMRMFMDMVGISESDSIPAAMTFGMMFGANQSTVDEWSTDDDGDGDYEDDDCDDCDDDDCDEEDEYIPDEYFDEYPAMASAMGGAGPLPMQMPIPPNMHPHPASHHMGSIHAAIRGKLNQPSSSATAASWEPQVKQYSNMNLKDQLNQQRMQMQQGEPDDNSDAGDQEQGEETEADRERKLKLAKKRAEKRKKQKEKDKKKTKETASNSSATNDDTLNTRDFVDCDQLDPEHLNKLIRLHTDHIITELMHSVTNGQLGKVNQILSYDFAEEVPEAVGKEMIALLKKELPTTPVLHHCITNLSRVNAAAAAAPGAGGDASTAAYNTAMFTALAARRLEVARYLLNFTQPVFELGTVDAAGLSVLHQAIASGDLKIAQLVLRSITQGPEDRKTNLNVNSRCHRQGWAPIHYAVERADIEAVKLLVQSGANVQCTMATDKRQTPMELARQKMKGVSAVVKASLQAIVDELLVAIEKSKILKESESKSKKAEAVHSTAGDAGPKNSNSSKEKVSAKDKEKDKKPEVAPETPAKVIPAPVPASVPVTAATPAVAPASDKKKKKKDKTPDSAVQPVQAVPELVAAPLPIPPVPKVPSQSPPAVTPAVSATTVSAKNAKKNAKKNAAAAAAVPAAPQPTINAQAEMSVSSRDEMVDRLLAMGFRESDCLNAISLYGTDVDQAISWLCERPAVSTPTAAAPARPLEAETSKAAEPVPAAAPMTLAAAMAAGAAMSSARPAPSSSAKLQKEKEELRRINRAWNQKAEEEKRKAEAQKKQAELEKQQELLLQKQQQELLRQQQAQQEYIYQQHLQQQQQVQYLAMQQQMQSQQQAYFPSWGTQQSGPMYGIAGADGSATAQSMVQQQYSNNGAASNASFPVGSLQHMTTMLGAPQHSSVPGGSSASGSGFGAHPSIVTASSTGGHSAPASSMQTLSGAMALAMDPAALHAHSRGQYGASSAHTSIPTLSIGDAMAMGYNSHSHGGQAPSAPQQSALLFGSSSLDSGRLSSSFDGFTSGGADVYGDLPLNDPLVDGALELSAVAKPFVPRFGPSTGAGAGSASSTSSVLSNSPVPVHSSPMLSSMLAPPPPALSAAFGSSLSGSSLGGLNLGAGLGSSPWGSGVSLGMDVKINPSTAESKISSYLSNLLPSELNLDEDNYEYGDANDIIPDLDSFLLNDN